MKRKIAALALGAALVLTGACSKGEPEATSDAGTDTGTTYAPEDLQLVDVPVSKPAPGTKVDAAALPAEVSNFAAVPGISPDQQTCINGAMKQAIDADPTLAKTPGKVASLGGGAVAVCDAGAVFTEPLLQGLATGEAGGKVQLTPQQSTCLKDAFAADKASTGKLISGSMTLNATVIQEALAPFEAKCGVKLNDALNGQ
jgi:hypothetical protein